VTGSVGDLVSARTPGRTAPDQSVLAVVQGLAACDVALAAFAWERATA
jgi:ornithine cyclodeaminase